MIPSALSSMKYVTRHTPSWLKLECYAPTNLIRKVQAPPGTNDSYLRESGLKICGPRPHANSRFSSRYVLEMVENQFH